MNIIDRFEGKYRFLSNFYPSLLIINGIKYPTVEHAFQALKTKDIKKRIEISKLETPGKAKRVGKSLKLRDDWEKIKLDIMENLIRLKFSKHKNLRNKLLATGNAILIEGNWWGDIFWGVCNNKGENYLGKILMKIREELKNRDIDN